MNEIERKKNIEKSNKNKNWFFEKINKIEKPLVRLIKKKKRTQIHKIRDEKGEVTKDITEIQQKEIIALNERIDELSGKLENLISGGDNK